MLLWQWLILLTADGSLRLRAQYAIGVYFHRGGGICHVMAGQAGDWLDGCLRR